jgi:hypothetical protein
MSLFDSFTRPKWQHKNPEVRKSAIDQLDDEQLLLELVKTDPDSAVQSKALARISDPDTLDGLIESLPAALQQQSRAQRLQQLLPDPGKITAIEDDAVLLRIASLSDEPELISSAISRVRSNELRLEVASTHPVARVRLNAAQGIEDMELLGELRNRSRGHDKAVYRHCKSLLDEHHARLREEAERREKVLDLTSRAKELAAAVDSPEYKGRYQLLQQQWKAVGTWAKKEEAEQFQRHLAICSGRLAKLSEARAAEEHTKARIERASLEFPAIASELEKIGEGAAALEELAEIKGRRAELDALVKRWRAAEEITPASGEQSRAFGGYMKELRSITGTLQSLIEKQPQLEKALSEAKNADSSDHQLIQKQIKGLRATRQSLSWPVSQAASRPQLMERLDQAQSVLEDKLGKLERSTDKYVERLESALKTLHSELDQDHVKNADKALRKARNALKALGPDYRQRFEHELKPLAARLREAHDWEGFAIEPKKAELCARMRALIGSEEDTTLLAEQIKALQREWKQIGALPHAREQALWNEFKEASDEAWKPCKAAQEAQAQKRRENYQQRMALIAQLVEYEEKMAWPETQEADSGDVATGEAGDADGETADETAGSKSQPPPDWRKVQKTLDTARKAFRNIQPVSKKDERRSQKALRSICDRIYGHIREEYGRNIALKENIVARAEALCELGDMHLAMDRAKRLQHEWKAVGMTPVSVDRTLWKAFRAACDAVFNRMDEQRQQDNAEIDARVKQAESLHDRARALLDSDEDDDRRHLKKELSDLKQEFLEIDLPRGARQRLGKDFKELENTVQEKISARRAQKENDRWLLLLDKINACAMKTTDEAAAHELWRREGDLPKGIEEPELDVFWQQGPAGDNDEELREACIALEILAEIETPAEDREARMKYQMQRLVEGLGSQQHVEMPLESSINDFINLRPTTPWAERFCACVEQMRKPPAVN